MKLYNTLSKKVEEFIPYKENVVNMYTCGPTVYHYAHIGNLRTYISEDVLEKSLKYLGYEVKRVMNITDVGHLVGDGDSGEDKMAVASKREHKSSLEIAEFYTEAFKSDCAKLNIITHYFCNYPQHTTPLHPCWNMDKSNIFPGRFFSSSLPPRKIIFLPLHL